MKLHEVLLQDGRVTANRRCGFCEGYGVYNGDICFCVVMYYGQPPSRTTIEQLNQALKKHRKEQRNASNRNS